MKTVLLDVSWPGEVGVSLFFQQSQLRAEAPSCPHLSLHAPFQRYAVTSWGPGVHGASWVHVRGLSRSPARHTGNPPLPLDKGCSRLCFSGVTEPDASNPPAGPDLQWLWGLPGPDARLQASEAAAKGGGAGIFSLSHPLSGSRASGANSLGVMLHCWPGPRIL
jgi:hypothetical protein